MKRTLTFAAALALGAAVLMPLPASAQVGLSVFINAAPPAPRYESVPAPRNGYVWAPGFWNWEGNRHVWISGHWEAARPGYQFQHSEWQRDRDGWRLNRGGWQQVSDQRGYDVIRIAPPEPRYERIPRARHGYVWVPGYWNWRGNRHEWVRGTWMPERPGYVYAQPSWRQRDGQWYLEQGRWEEARRHGRDRDHDGVPDRFEGGADRDRDGVPDRLEGRDRDRDGVPDRLERRDGDRDGVPDAYDRDRDNDGVRNRYDADRDGDGVRNDQDRYPDDRSRR
jgi:hypothetical protein